MVCNCPKQKAQIFLQRIAAPPQSTEWQPVAIPKGVKVLTIRFTNLVDKVNTPLLVSMSNNASQAFIVPSHRTAGELNYLELSTYGLGFFDDAFFVAGQNETIDASILIVGINCNCSENGCS